MIGNSIETICFWLYGLFFVPCTCSSCSIFSVVTFFPHLYSSRDLLFLFKKTDCCHKSWKSSFVSIFEEGQYWLIMKVSKSYIWICNSATKLQYWCLHLKQFLGFSILKLTCTYQKQIIRTIIQTFLYGYDQTLQVITE